MFVQPNTIDDSLLPHNSTPAYDNLGSRIMPERLAKLFENVNDDGTVSREDANHIWLTPYSSEIALVFWVADEISAAYFVRRFLRSVNFSSDAFSVGAEFHFTVADYETEVVYDINFRFEGYKEYPSLNARQGMGPLVDSAEVSMFGHTAINNINAVLR
jgi:hypothetical protein